MKLNRASLLYSTLLLTGVSAIVQVIGFVYRIFLSRLIGAETMGLYQLIMPVYSVILSIAVSGLTMGLSTLSAEYHALGNRRAVGQLLRASLLALLLLWLPVAIVILLFSDPISVYLLGDARTQLGLLLLLPCLLLTGVENLHKHHFYGLGNVRLPAAVELGEQLVRTAAVLSLLLLFLPQSEEKTVGLIVAGMVVSEIFSSCALLILRRRTLGPIKTLPGPGVPPPQLRRRMFRVALPLAAANLLGTLISSLNSILIPQRLVRAGMEVSQAMSSFGVMFGMTLPLLTLPSAFIMALCTVLVPKLTQCTALGCRRDCQDKISKAMLATSVIILPIMALLVTLGPSVGEALFQDPRVGDYIVPLSLGVALSCYQSILSAALNGVGRQSWAAGSSLLCGAIQLFFTWWGTGIPSVGLYGYVLGLIVSSAAAVFLNLALVAKRTGLRLSLFQSVTAPGLAALLMGLCVNLLYRNLLARCVPSIPAILSCLGFGALLYFITLWVQGVHPLRLFHLR